MMANTYTPIYIQNQQEHHRCKSFSEEYVERLKPFNVPHDQRYIFQPVELLLRVLLAATNEMQRATIAIAPRRRGSMQRG
jgi:hypothetical protein